jgi:RNA polymerase sigma-70 factor (family 1)
MIKKELRYTPETELALLKETAGGNRDAYAALYQFFLPKLYHYIYPIIRSKEDTEELLQDIFLSLWEKKEELRNVRSLSPYIFRMARNRLMNIYEHQKVQRKALNYIFQHTEESSVTAEDNYVYRQYHEVVSHALNTLTPKRRQVFEMHTQQDLSHDKIAVELSISKSMVKKQLYAAKRHVKGYLQQYAGITTIIAAIINLVLKR